MANDDCRDHEKLREQLIGLGEHSLRKSYYPELQQLMEDLKRFRALLDETYDLIFLLQVPSGNIIDINKSACNQLGYTRQQLLFTSFELLLVKPRSLWPNLMKSLNGIPYRLTTTNAFIKRKGDAIPVEITFNLVSFENDEYAVVVARDITERLIAEEKPQKAHLMLEQRVEERTAALLQLSESLKAEIAERKKAEEQLIFNNMHDFATGLFNRAYFSEEMRRLDTGRYYPVSIIVGDVDGLKIINDCLGHDAGDKLLVEAARIIITGVREGDVAARIGGDEFVILLPYCTSQDAVQVISRMKLLIKDYNLINLELPLHISFGCATTTSKNKSMDAVYKEADNNMYQEKREQRPATRNSLFNSLNHILISHDFCSAVASLLTRVKDPE